MDNINTMEEFLSKMGPQFHTRLMLYYENVLKDEYKADDETVIGFQFPEGEYSIKYRLLKERADEETLQLLDDNGLKINMGPLRADQNRIEKATQYIEVVPMKNDTCENADHSSTI